MVVCLFYLFRFSRLSLWEPLRINRRHNSVSFGYFVFLIRHTPNSVPTSIMTLTALSEAKVLRMSPNGAVQKMALHLNILWWAVYAVQIIMPAVEVVVITFTILASK